MKKDRNPTNLFAKDCIAQALIKLMKQKKYEDITITDIAKTAGVSRVTYYRNYNSKEDIITHHLDELGYQFQQQTKHLDPTKDRYAFALTFFRHWSKHSEFLLCLSEAKQSYIMLEHINTSISILATTPKKKYEACFFVGSMHNILFEWMKDGTKESPEEMATILCELHRAHFPFPKEKIESLNRPVTLP